MAHFKVHAQMPRLSFSANHYDTVPADSDAVWIEDHLRFLCVISCMDLGLMTKEHITARLSALKEKHMQHHDDLPVNISFIMERS